MLAQTIRPLIYLISATALIAGCRSTQPQPGPLVEESRPDEMAALAGQLEECQRETERMRHQLELAAFIDRGLNDWVHIETISFGQYTRGLDEDKNGVDDGVRIYLVVRDQDGDRIKVSGTMALELWDLSVNPPRSVLQRQYDAQALRKCWMGGLLADHYLVDLHWESDPPAVKTLTIKCRLTEFLTDKTFEIQQALELKTAPGR